MTDISQHTGLVESFRGYIAALRGIENSRPSAIADSLEIYAQALSTQESRIEGLEARTQRALRSLKALQDGAAIAMATAPDEGPVADFLAAIHREAVRGQLASDEVINDEARALLDLNRGLGGEGSAGAESARTGPHSPVLTETPRCTGEEFLEFKEALSDLRSLRHEHDCLNGGGPGWAARNKAAWDRVDALFADEDEAAWHRQQEDAHG